MKLDEAIVADDRHVGTDHDLVDGIGAVKLNSHGM